MTANGKVEILWIDDEVTDHTEDGKNLEYLRKGLKVSIVHPKNLDNELTELKKTKKTPDLFLVDYFLDEVKFEGEGNGKYQHRGLAVAGRLRELAPEYPIYVVSQRDTKKEGIFLAEAQAARAVFDKILTFKEVQREGTNILYYDAIDYRSIRKSARRDLKALFNLLQAPDDLVERLKVVLPNELREGLALLGSRSYPEGNAIAFAKWVREVLLTTPGFLYEELHAATYLGLTIRAFRTISKKLKQANYNGVFSRTTSPLWWVAKLNQMIFSFPKAKETNKTNPWELSPIVFNIPEKMQAKCIVCGELFPESVGANLKDDSDLKPVHYRCSIPHPNKRRELYFDEPRGFEIK